MQFATGISVVIGLMAVCGLVRIVTAGMKKEEFDDCETS